MNKYWLIAVALFVATFVSTTAFAGSAEAIFDRELPSAGINEFTLSNTNGEVQLLATEGDKIVIHATKKVTGPLDSECKDLLDNLQIEVKQTATDVEIKHSKFNKMLYNATIEYIIHLPVTIKANIETTNGSIVCKGRYADCDLESTNGALEIVHCSGNMKAETTNGAITAECTSSRASFESTNGTLHLKVALNDNGKLTAETTNGSIHLRIPKEVSATLSAETTNGEISSDAFDSSIKLNKHHTKATGNLGTGNGTIRLETTNGSISIDAL